LAPPAANWQESNKMNNDKTTKVYFNNAKPERIFIGLKERICIISIIFIYLLIIEF
jgi:hypothetical protein